ncbi:hypothetical protein BZZ08_03821 [Streptomyces sp. MH60]|nr:hypothetical protein BZZ08_03821 [Streptomyces sp. MH60]
MPVAAGPCAQASRCTSTASSTTSGAAVRATGRVHGSTDQTDINTDCNGSPACGRCVPTGRTEIRVARSPGRTRPGRPHVRPDAASASRRIRVLPITGSGESPHHLGERRARRRRRGRPPIAPSQLPLPRGLVRWVRDQEPPIKQPPCRAAVRAAGDGGAGRRAGHAWPRSRGDADRAEGRRPRDGAGRGGRRAARGRGMYAHGGRIEPPRSRRRDMCGCRYGFGVHAARADRRPAGRAARPCARCDVLRVAA